MDLQVGQLLGQYVVERPLGSGGMGTVWAARGRESGRAVALKALRSEQSALAEARARLRRESQATRAITHPAIVQVIEVLDCDDDGPILVMELLHGETLRALIQREQRLTLARAAGLLAPVAHALAQAHLARVIHRDLKPENVFLEVRATPAGGATELVRLLDFGVARFYEKPPGSDGSQLTRVGTMLGTAAYMAPEQAVNPAEVDHRVDVWAFGVTLYEVLSGCRPIEGAGNNDTLRQLLVGSITPIQFLRPELPAQVTDLVGAMLSRNPERRPSDCQEIAQILESYALAP